MSIILKQETAASIPTPAAGKATIFIDSADDLIKKKLDDGSVSTVDGSSAVVAGDVDFTPAGDIIATDVQAAIEELDAEKLELAHKGAGGVAEHAVATGSVAGFMSPSDKTKLDGVASGATANDTDANIKNRANHTGTQLASTISDFDSAADVRAAAAVATHAGLADPHPGYAVDADVAAAQAYAAARANHTGSQTASTISDFTAAAKAAAVQDSISNGIADIAPSQNAVFDALALKSDTGHTHVVADITDYASSQALKADVAGDTFTGQVVVEGDNNGTGSLNLKSQNSDAPTPASGVSLFSDTNEMFSIRGQSGFKAVINDQNLTDNRQFD